MFTVETLGVTIFEFFHCFAKKLKKTYPTKACERAKFTAASLNIKELQQL